MRIVHIEDFFHPSAGYQVNILSKYMRKQGHEVYVVTSELDKMPEYLTSFFGKDNISEKDKDFYRETGVKIIRIPLLKYASGRSIYNSKIFNVVDELKPDILYVHGNDTLIGIQYILRSGNLKYPIVLDSHMLEMASKNRFNQVFRLAYKKLITPQIVKHKLTVIRTQNDAYVEKCLGIPIAQAPWISTGSDLMLFHQDKLQKQLFREQNNVGKDSVIAIYVGKLDEAKGGKLLARTFEEKLVSSNGKELVLLVVGNTTGEYGREVEAIFNRSKNRILRFPTQNYIDLPKFYQAGDFAVFPRQCSLSFYDAQACKLPVIAEDNNINLDRLNINNGLSFKEGDAESFRNKLITMIELDEEEFESMCMNAFNYVKDNYNYEDIANQYLKILTSIKKS